VREAVHRVALTGADAGTGTVEVAAIGADASAEARTMPCEPAAVTATKRIARTDG
jgi:hypothetical protein